MKRGFHQTRPEVIAGHTNQMLHERRCSMGTFAQRVVEHYLERVPPAARSVEFKVDGDPFDQARINAQKLKRYMDAGINARLPCELEEAWVLALDEPYRSACLRDLARRYGLLAVVAPEGAATANDVQAFATTTREFGEWMQSMAPTLADGRITVSDAPHLDSAIEHAEQLLAAVTAVHTRLLQVRNAVPDTS